jgi:SAM-dependent methyltransferase
MPDMKASQDAHLGVRMQPMSQASPPNSSNTPSRSGYVTDVPYPRAFVAQITPPTLRLVAALNGHPAPPEDDCDYCELGCASGDTLTTVAAANPNARFVGVDLNEEHIALATSRARRGQVSNVRFATRDFEDLAAEALPTFDFIVAHGIWSWVSAPKRAAALAFVEAHLKPGGIFFVSYNALPGWAAIEPLRRLMLEHTAASAKSGNTLDRAREGVQLAQRLADSGAAFFASHPTAKAMLGLMQKNGLPYVVHEYFHANWQPMYFADVARSLGAAGLDYLGQVPLYANVRSLAIPPSLKRMAESITDRVALEGLKDFATNELFRCDVYAKGTVTRSTSETRYYFEGTPFGTLAPSAQVKREVRLPFYSIDYKEPVYDAILEVIAERPSTAMELALLPQLAEVGQLRLGDCLQNLALGGQVVPMRPRAESRVGPGGYRVALPYNELVLGEALAETGPLVFASPVTGSGVQVSLLEALCIRLVAEPALAPEAYGDRVRAYAASRPMPLLFGEKKIKDGDELVKVMAREIERFRASSLPKLLELGVLEPA